MTIHPVRPEHKLEWLRMRLVLWPEDDAHGEVLERYFSQPKANFIVMVAQTEDGEICGFIEVGSRSYAEGCETSPVAYIEGWYVDPENQKQGVGRLLIKAAEAWAWEQGFSEVGSDTWLENTGSIQAHKALGYEEVGRQVCFAKRL